MVSKFRTAPSPHQSHLMHFRSRLTITRGPQPYKVSNPSARPSTSYRRSGACVGGAPRARIASSHPFMHTFPSAVQAVWRKRDSQWARCSSRVVCTLVSTGESASWARARSSLICSSLPSTALLSMYLVRVQSKVAHRVGHVGAILGFRDRIQIRGRATQLCESMLKK